MKFCEACGHPQERHAAFCGCDVCNCHCTARYGKPTVTREPEVADDEADQTVLLGKAADKIKLLQERLNATVVANVERSAWQGKSIKIEQERAAELRQMLEGQKARTELFKDECEQWRHAARQFVERALGNWFPGGLTLAMFKVEAKAIVELLDRTRVSAEPDMAEFLAREAIQYERNTLRVFMGFLKIAAALGDEASLCKFREIMEAYRKVEEGRR